MEVDMKIKRYTAVSMRAALAQVRAEQGPDAVILSSRRSDQGIEVIAAVDYDEALFVDATRQRASTVSPEVPMPAPNLSPEPSVAPLRAQPATRHQSPSRAQTPLITPRPPTPAPSPKLIPASFRRMTAPSSTASAMLQVAAPATVSPRRSETVGGAASMPARAVRADG